MRLNNRTIFQILLYWVAVVAISSLVISIFSSLVPFERLESYLQEGITSKNTKYIRLSLYFYAAWGAAMAIAGTASNVLFYTKLSYKIARIWALAGNLVICSGILFIYYQLHISRLSDFQLVIVPSYMISILLFAAILPAKLKS